MRLTLIVASVVAVLAVAAQDSAAVEAAARAAKEPPKLTLQASAADVLIACREMLPTRPIEECDYRLRMRRGHMETHLSVSLFARHETNELASVKISRRGNARPTIELISDENSKPVESPLERVMDTDVTWLDLTFDFLWWTDAVYEEDREGETVHGQTCMVILVRPQEKIAGLEAVRLWADKKTGCLMQAEQLGDGMKPIRRLWGTRVKKFGERWMVSVLEVETLGSRHRTKITVEDLKEL